MNRWVANLLIKKTVAKVAIRMSGHKGKNKREVKYVHRCARAHTHTVTNR